MEYKLDKKKKEKNYDKRQNVVGLTDWKHNRDQTMAWMRVSQWVNCSGRGWYWEWAI